MTTPFSHSREKKFFSIFQVTAHAALTFDFCKIRLYALRTHMAIIFYKKNEGSPFQ